MVKKLLPWLALPALAAAAGALGWCGPFWLIPATLAAPVCSTWASSRVQAWAVGFAYMAATSFDLNKGATAYFNAPILGATLWLVDAVLVGLGWCLVWHSARRVRLWLLPLGFVLTALPPFGVVTWCHPLVSAGCLFPGWGWIGLAALLGLAVALAALPRHWAGVGLACVLALSYGLQKPARVPPDWRPISTHFDCGMTRDYLRDYQRLQAVKEMIRTEHQGRVLVFGESVGGLWSKTTAALWADHQGPTVVFGCEIPVQGTGQYDNGLVAVDAQGARVIYRQRMPIPFSMWRPWTTASGCRPFWFQNPVIEFHGQRIAPLICYEESLVWPVLHSMAAKPTMILTVANDWWARNTIVPRVMENTAQSWARLFDVPLVLAFNY